MRLIAVIAFAAVCMGSGLVGKAVGEYTARALHDSSLFPAIALSAMALLATASGGLMGRWRPPPSGIDMLVGSCFYVSIGVGSNLGTVGGMVNGGLICLILALVIAGTTLLSARFGGRRARTAMPVTGQEIDAAPQPALRTPSPAPLPARTAGEAPVAVTPPPSVSPATVAPPALLAPKPKPAATPKPEPAATPKPAPATTPKPAPAAKPKPAPAPTQADRVGERLRALAAASRGSDG